MPVQQSNLPEHSEVSAPVRHRFPNGLTLLVQEDHSHPLAAFHAVVPTGSATEGKFLGTGISHVVEHMLFKGTARRPVGAVEKEARSYGGTSQGSTTYDTTSYQLIVNREHWSEAADLMVDALFFSTLDSEELLKERDVVLRELKMRRDDPSQVAWDLLFDNAYRVHPYKIPIIGYEPLLMKITAEDVREYHRMHYVPNRMTIAVVGDVEPSEVIRRFGELLKDIPPGKVTQESLPEEPLPFSPREIIEEADIQLGIVTIGMPSVAAADPDLFALDLLAYLLGGERGSRLEKALKETGIVHAVQCWNYTPQARGLFSVTMRLDPGAVHEAIAGVWKEFARAASEPFPAEELEAAKRALLRQYLSGRQTVGGEASDLGGYEVLVGDPLFAARYLDRIRKLQAVDLQQAAQRILVKERATTVTLLPRSAAQESKPAASRPAEPVLELVRLENGVRVILREDRRLPLVTLQASMLGGVRYETDSTNGISHLTAQMLLRGTRHKNKDQINDSIKQMGGELNSFSGRNSLGLTLSVVSSELAHAVPLFGEILSEPAFPADEL
ncbi:MAG: insulinase family protein, partial [Candidatus Omnitrophota bacterium]|nr:insulinase family protein [Candidatus Omnitrophota bacterium]